MAGPQLKIDGEKVNLTPAEWCEVAAYACGEAPARCDVQTRSGTKGAPMALHSETPTTLDGPDGPAVLAAELWRMAVEFRTRNEGRMAFRLVVFVGDDQHETSWHEIAEGEVGEISVDEAVAGNSSAMAWRQVNQMHNVMMRQQSAVAGVLEKLAYAGNAQMEAVQKAIELQQAGGMAMLESERESYDIKRDEMEMQYYAQMFGQWLTHMQNAKTMNNPNASQAPPVPTTCADACRAFHGSLCNSQVGAMQGLLGVEETDDILSAVYKAGQSPDEDAQQIAVSLVPKLAPHQGELVEILGPPHVPVAVGTWQQACLRVCIQAAMG